MGSLRRDRGILILHRPYASVHSESALHRGEDRRLLKDGVVQHREPIRNRSLAQSQLVHKARREDRGAARVTKAQHPLERGEKLQPERVGLSIVLDGLHLELVQLADHHRYRVGHPVEQGREDLKKRA